MKPSFNIDQKFSDSFVFSGAAESDGQSGSGSLKLGSVLGNKADASGIELSSTAGLQSLRAVRAEMAAEQAELQLAENLAEAPVEVTRVEAPFEEFAISPAWDVGQGIGPSGEGVSIIGNPSVVRKYTSGSSDGSGFNVDIVFRGNTWTQALQQSFIDAAELLSDMIVGDVADARVIRNIDDIKIFAEVSDIDGAGGVLGQAGPISYRTDTFIPANGTMTFDVADAETFDSIGMFNDIVFHEMMHVLGFGTMWELMGLVTAGPNNTLEFNGANATQAYHAEGGVGAIQIETDGGPGTAGGHWDEDLYGSEIMTGFINTTGNFLSNTTIASLEDMGYDTIYDPNDPLAATASLDMTIFNDHV